MGTTMDFLLADRAIINDLAEKALNRRKQLCPFPLTIDEMIDVMHRPDVAEGIRYLMADCPKVLKWAYQAMLYLHADDHPSKFLIVRLSTSETLPLAVSARVRDSGVYAAYKADIVVCDGPLMPRLKDWAWKATQVELENRWARKIISDLVDNATTHQQVHRYIPELYILLANQEESIPSGQWGYRHRIKEVYEALQVMGSSRAHKIVLEGVTPRDRSNLKTLIAQTMMLPITDGIKTVPFHSTWISI